MRELGAPLFLALCLAHAGNAAAAVLNVPGDYSTIQSAITASDHGDEIILADQTYTGPGNRNLIIHGKAIAIRSAGDDPTTCILDLQGSSEDAARAFGFTVDRPQRLCVTVFDAAGRRVAELVDGPHTAGRHELSWDGRDEQGTLVASGSYLVRASGERGSDAQRVTLLK